MPMAPPRSWMARVAHRRVRSAFVTTRPWITRWRYPRAFIRRARWSRCARAAPTAASAPRIFPGESMFNRESRAQSRIDILVGKSARVHGDIDFTGGLHIDGHVFGGVSAYGAGESTVSVSETGIIEGGVVATHVVVNGVVRGDVHASGKVALGPSARVIGNVQYGIIESAIGAEITGTLVQVRPPAK